MDREKKIRRFNKTVFITSSCCSDSVCLIFIFIFIQHHVLNKVPENNDSKRNHIKGNFIFKLLNEMFSKY